MRLLEPQWLLLLPSLLLVLAMMLVALRARRRALRRFYGSDGPRPWAPWPSTARALARGLLVCSALACVLLALARPVYNPKPKPVQRAGRDVVFLVDVSRSMLAQDLRPSRLDTARIAVSDALDAVQGERVGIIAFAGSAVVKAPLTTDIAFARMALDQLSPDSVSRGGTAIGDAIRTATTLLTSDRSLAGQNAHDGRFRDIILLTDGEDHQTDPLGAAKDAADAGIRIICVGLGSDLQGATIPVAAPAPKSPAAAPVQNFVLEQDGEQVRTKADPDSLAKIAQATPGGKFYNVGTGSIEMDSVYRRLMRDAERRMFDATPAMSYTEAFQWPLTAGLLLLLAEPFLGEFTRRRWRTNT